MAGLKFLYAFLFFALIAIVSIHGQNEQDELEPEAKIILYKVSKKTMSSALEE
jgi:hypothetical protein